jgi:hypothetical protein
MVDEAQGIAGGWVAEYEATLTAATGRKDVVDALHWLGEGRPLTAGAHVASLLPVLVEAADARLPGADAALRFAVRSALGSTLDTSADLVLTDTIIPPHEYGAALGAVVQRIPSGNLADISSAAVVAAQAQNSLVMETLALVAGLSWRDLQARSEARGVALPGEATSAWSMQQLQSAFAVIDDIVCGRGKPQLDGAIAARPVELLLKGSLGWAEIERLRIDGVPYETLLTQRDVGSAWSAHRNRSGAEISRLMACTVLEALYAEKVACWSMVGDAPVSKKFLAAQVGILSKPPGQLSIVTRGINGKARYAVLTAIARDGGTARKTGATLLKLPERFSVPAALVLIGTGWADRGESDDLVRAYGGRVYTEHTLADLAHLAGTVGGG